MLVSFLLLLSASLAPPFVSAAAFDFKQFQFHEPKDTDSRSPCPVMNTFSNHGIFPRNGLSLTRPMLQDAFMKVLNLDAAFSAMVANMSNPFLHPDGKFDLHDLARHNVIEHDASMTRDDAAPGETFAPVPTNTTKVELVLAVSADGVRFTEDDFALAKSILERSLTTPLGALQAPADAESPLILSTFGAAQKDGSLAMSVQALRNVFKINRFPDGFVAPKTPVSPAVIGASLTRFLARKKVLDAL
ncbi:Cloroperoxidase [Mycena kentingensis (nom. inval.)]|nr:Cloroperoxidase [Mycena kentingensis (nom. inval.)]